MIVTASFLGATWRFAVTLLALGIIGLFWYLLVSNITPFPGTESEKKVPKEPGKRWSGPKLPSKYPRIQRFTVICDVILFVWIVVEGALVIPFMLIKFGLH